jgi:serine/threonine protein kinase/WD40 repeat protein
MLKRGFQFAPGYRLQEFLGRGQFGQVWRASAPGGAAAAVKFIDLSGGQGEKEYDAVRRVKQIRHANLMPITAIWLLDAQGAVIEEAPDEAVETIDLSVVEEAGQSVVYQHEVEPSWLVVAMLLAGKSLQKRLQECVADGLPGIPPKELISYMDEAAKGIDFLNTPQHDLGSGPIAIQHSDIKPANIVLIGSSAVVCDFGLARILSRNQVTATSAAGTPAYMAPEAISGKPARTSDQYSLAVTYYHLRTGSLPVSDGSLWEVLDAHRHGKLSLGLVPEAEQLVLRKATDLDWENRFANNLEFVEALREALRAEGETRPSFIAPSSSSPSGDNSREPTRSVAQDAIATLDLDSTASSTDGSLHTTAPFVAAEQSTRSEAFANEALPALAEAAATSASDGAPSIADRIKRYPLASAGIAAAALALISVAVIASQDDEVPEQIEGVRQDDTGIVEERTAKALLAEAMSLVDTDSERAATLFKSAREKDRSLVPEMGLLTGPTGSVMQMEATKDGSWLVAMDDGPAPILHHLRTKDSPLSLNGHETLLNALALDPTDTLLLTGGFDSDARVWNLRSEDVANHPLLLSGHQGEIDTVAWGAAKPIAITCSNNPADRIWEIGLWEIAMPSQENGAPRVIRDRRVPIGEKLKSIDSDPTDTWLAAIALGDNPIEPEVDVVAWSWDELWNADGAPDPLRLQIENAEKIQFLSHQEKPRIAVGESGGTLSIYNVSKGSNLVDQVNEKNASTGNHIEAMKVVATSQDDVIAAGTADGAVLWWKFGDSSEFKRRALSESSVSCLDVSSDGRWVAMGTAGGTAWLWDSSTDEDFGLVGLPTEAGSVDSIVISSGSNQLIAGCADGKIRTWNLAHVKLMALITQTHAITSPRPEIESPGIAMRD